MKAFRLLSIFLLGIILFSCNKDDSPTIAPPRDYDVQYATDIELIENFLTENYLTVDANLNVTFSEIGETGTEANIFQQQDYPLQFVTVKNDKRNSNLVDGLVEDPVDYKLYYIMLNEGAGSSPSTVDSVFVSYKGWRLDDVVFDQNDSPIWFDSNNLVSGFRQMLTLMKTAESFTDNPDGTVDFLNFGNAVVFIPSGLGYFNSSPVNIGSYQNLIFQLQMKSLNYKDHDRDGIRSKDEKYGANTNIWAQDTDGDNVPDFLDIDDDGDNFLTKIEIKDANGDYYDFEDIPSCSGDVTDPNRLKKHIDPACQ
uniref:FKBP-type peptidyl-prolyl cis-trans isomerase n=1 Tax=Flavobacterium sp. TaxID=239 RepID=UPI00404A8DF5